MDITHPEVLQPADPNGKVWRYMNLEKFQDILQTKALYLSRLDWLGDTHEGSLTKGEMQQAMARRNVLGWSGRSYDRSELEVFRQRLFASCWQMDNVEKNWMYKQYLPDNKGIVLQTTYQKLSSCCDDQNVRIGMAQYTDFDSEDFAGFKGLGVGMNKRHEFRDEREVRIIALHEITDDNTYPLGIHIPCNIIECIERIYVNPYADDAFKLLVEAAVIANGCGALAVEWSKIRTDPFFG